MKIVLLSVGKTDKDSFSTLIKEYTKRINHYTVFETSIVPDIKGSKKLPEKDQRILEGNNILKALQSTDYVVLLDDKGREYSSTEFADFIEKKSYSVAKRMVFVIGGPYGFSDDVYTRANEKVSLSRMTFTHQMVRLIFTEQLYRAMTILKGEPYHHE